MIARAVAFLLCFALVACAESKVASPDVQDATEASDVLPAPPGDCSQCHSSFDLGALHGAEAEPPRVWLGAQGHGLVRVDPVFPAPGTVYGLPWPARGRHDYVSLMNCPMCHPSRPSDGLGHGFLAYPEPARVFAPADTCARTCHTWLPDALAPDTLLGAADNGHSRIWRAGVRPKQLADYRFGAFNPGCGGCHNVAAENHGATLGCLDCHRMGAPGQASHDAHVKLIEDGQAQYDPEAKAAAVASCDYCHAPETGETPRSRAACYNCHLSGHQPMDGQGRAQGWPVPKAP